MKEADSRVWWSTIKKLAIKFETVLNKKYNKNSVFFKLDINKFDSALDMYEQSWWAFKKDVYGERANEEHIDRHKIISLYILSFLIKRPFHIVNKKEENADERFLANELFSLTVMEALISAWNGDKIFSMNENEKRWFVILLNYFKIKLKKSNSSYISSDPSSVTDILSLSQIIYYIEKSCKISLENYLAMLKSESKTKTNLSTKHIVELKTKLQANLLAEFQAKAKGKLKTESLEKLQAERLAKYEKYRKFINTKNSRH